MHYWSAANQEVATRQIIMFGLMAALSGEAGFQAAGAVAASSHGKHRISLARSSWLLAFTSAIKGYKALA